MGVFIEFSVLVWSPSPELRAMISVGFLGAFTTFSTFSLDLFTMLMSGEVIPAVSYVLLSGVVSLLALYSGLKFVKSAVSYLY